MGRWNLIAENIDKVPAEVKCPYCGWKPKSENGQDLCEHHRNNHPDIIRGPSVNLPRLVLPEGIGSAAGLRDITFNTLHVGHLPEEVVALRGEQRIADAMAPQEVNAFNQTFTAMMFNYRNSLLSYDLARIYNGNMNAIFHFIRCQKKISRLPFIGYGDGPGLVLTPLVPSMFATPRNPRNSWSTPCVGGTIMSWIGDGESSYKLSHNAAVIIFGEYRPGGIAGIIQAAQPSVSGRSSSWYILDPDVHEISMYPAPVIAFGDDTILIEHLPAVTGIDYSVPFGFGCYSTEFCHGGRNLNLTH